jgi:metallo-beta-lactamase family protein
MPPAGRSDEGRHRMSMKLRFLGAARNVTGSRYILDCKDMRILIDCGLYQERDFLARNWDPFPVPPESIDAVLLTHAHLDHSGYLPKLVKGGFEGRIFTTAATADITGIALLDSAHLLEEDVEFKKKRHAREDRKGPFPYEPLYTEQDVENTVPLFSKVNYGETVEVAGGIEASFHNAGHILGAAMIKVTVTQTGKPRTLIFSGDVGRWDKPILKDPATFDRADYIIVESTYGDRVHEDPKDIDRKLCDAIKSTRERGGNVLIPSFAIERTQEVLYHLNTLLLEDCIPHTMVYIDSPMAIKVTEVFKHYPELYDKEMADLVRQGHSPFNFPSLNFATTVHQSKAINHIKGTVIIIAGSGMCTGGRIKHHLVANISRPESTVLFVGYQARGTLGRLIAEGAEEARILGQNKSVRAKVVRIDGFSAHADMNELQRWLSALKSAPRHTFVTHGEEEAATSFAKLLHEKKGWKTSVPFYGDEADLD